MSKKLTVDDHYNNGWRDAVKSIANFISRNDKKLADELREKFIGSLGLEKEET